MPESVHLLGVEDVQRAARTMSSAAGDMLRAAQQIDDALHRHTQAMEEFAQRIESAVERLAAGDVMNLKERNGD